MLQALLPRLLARPSLQSLFSHLSSWSGVLVFNYHRIGDGSDSPYDRGLWSADAETFARQVRLFKQHLDLVSPEDLPEIRKSRSGRYGLITFDDGYRDNYADAFPVLRAERAPGLFFVTTGFMDSPRLAWWDEIAWMVRNSNRDRLRLPPWHANGLIELNDSTCEEAIRILLQQYKRISAEDAEDYLEMVAELTGAGRHGPLRGDENAWMTWDMLREMQAAGMTIGGHTVTHPVLSRCSVSRQLDELEQCAARLQAELGQPMRYFSYPVGGLSAFDLSTRDCLQELGVQFAFSYYGGLNLFHDWQDYDLRRVAVEKNHSLPWLKGLLTLPGFFA